MRTGSASNSQIEPVLDLQDQQPQQKPRSPRLPSLIKTPGVQSPIPGPPGYPFIAPIIHVSAATPPGLTHHDFSPTSAEPSPTLTLQVEPKTRSVPKGDTASSSPAGSPLTRVKGRSASDGEPSTSQPKPREPPVMFAGIANFGGKIGFDW